MIERQICSVHLILFRTPMSNQNENKNQLFVYKRNIMSQNTAYKKFMITNSLFHNNKNINCGMLAFKINVVFVTMPTG